MRTGHRKSFIMVQVTADLIFLIFIPVISGFSDVERTLLRIRRWQKNTQARATKAPAASVRVQNNILSSLTNTASANAYTISQLFNFVKSFNKN